MRTLTSQLDEAEVSDRQRPGGRRRQSGGRPRDHRHATPAETAARLPASCLSARLSAVGTRCFTGASELVSWKWKTRLPMTAPDGAVPRILVTKAVEGDLLVQEDELVVRRRTKGRLVAVRGRIHSQADSCGGWIVEESRGSTVEAHEEVEFVVCDATEQLESSDEVAACQSTEARKRGN
jgi:hypothetical protein